MRVAVVEDKNVIVEILTAAFINNKSVNYLIPQDGLRFYRIYKLMEYSVEMCMLFGKVYLSDDRKGCALLLYPHLKKFSFRAVLLDVMLIFRSIGLGNVLKAMQREKLIKAKQPSQPMAYLWFIGVEPKYQRFGLGRRLLEEVMASYALEELPIYLETSTMENLPWYKKFGFEVYDKLELSYTLYFLRRSISV